MAKLIESVKETTGVDLAEVLKANTYDAKVTRNINLTGIPDGDAGNTTEAAESVAADVLMNEDDD